MKKSAYAKYAVILCAVLSFIGLGYGEEKVYESKPRQIWDLPVTKAESGAPLYYTAIGTVVSDQRVEVTSKLSGYIRKIDVKEGDRVNKGQLLVKIDSTEISSSINQAKAAVTSAEAVYRNAEIDKDRYEKIFKRGSISDNEMRKINLKYETAAENLKQANAAYSAALSFCDYAEIKSPVDGVVVAKSKQIGDLAVPGVPIVTLEAKKGFMIETYAAESRIASIKAGDKVQVAIDGISEPLFGGVRSVVTAADPVTRSYQVKVTLPETEGLMPGMFGRVSFQTGMSSSLIIPRGALVERGGLRGVFVVDSQQRARFRWLRIGREWPERVEVDAGLDQNEYFVAAAGSTLRDGDKIRGKEVAR
jgi:RND family efflux transporter MFP subunit